MGKGNKYKNIGKRFEERVSEYFRKGWGLPPTAIHRALSSGTYKVDFSDIVFTNFERWGYYTPNLVVECKRRKSIPLNKYITLEISEIPKWLSQLNDGKSKFSNQFGINTDNVLGILVVGIPNLEPFVVITTADLEYLRENSEKYNLTFNPNLTFPYVVNPQLDVVGFKITHFLKLVKPKKLRIN